MFGQVFEPYFNDATSLSAFAIALKYYTARSLLGVVSNRKCDVSK